MELKCFRFNKWLPTECRNERCRVQMLMKYQLRDGRNKRWLVKRLLLKLEHTKGPKKVSSPSLFSLSPRSVILLGLQNTNGTNKH